MSRRRLPPPPPPDDAVEVDPDDEDPDEPDDDEEVEYFVEVEDDDSCLTSVPKSAQSLQTSSSAPSIFAVVGSATSVPHISHWTIPGVSQRTA
jgi:hypothetical protein